MQEEFKPYCGLGLRVTYINCRICKENDLESEVILISDFNRSEGQYPIQYQCTKFHKWLYEDDKQENVLELVPIEHYKSGLVI